MLKQLDEKQSLKLIWDTREEVNKAIEAVSKRAYTLLGTWHHKDTKEDPEQYIRTSSLEMPEPEKKRVTSLEELDAWAKELEAWAKKLQMRTELIQKATLLNIQEIRDRAGGLLAAQERLTFNYQIIRGTPSPPPSDPQCGTILSRILFIVFTARDHIIAAKGHLRNWTKKVGAKDLLGPIGSFIVVGVLYVIFHPELGLFSIAFHRLWYEIIFWSLVGAISHALVRIGSETLLDSYDPVSRINLMWKIPLAPVFGFAALLLIEVFGIAVGPTPATRVLSTTAPNYPFIWLVSFLAGYFSRKVLDRLEGAASMIFKATSK